MGEKFFPIKDLLALIDLEKHVSRNYFAAYKSEKEKTS